MRFEYLEPKTIGEAIGLLERYNGKARILAGGTDLVVQTRRKTISPEYVVDLGLIPGLDYIRYDSNKALAIGPLATVRSVETSDEVKKYHPLVAYAASQLASAGIRNIATVGGNLCNAAPSAETAPSLIALGTQLKIVGPAGERTVPLEDFFTGPGKTVLGRGEIVVEIQVPPVKTNMKGIYFKHSVRGSIDLAIVGVAAVLTVTGSTCEDARIVLGAVAPVPMRAKRAEAVITGKKFNDALIEQCAQAAAEESQPISDVRSSAEYRKEMVQVFTRRALKELTAV